MLDRLFRRGPREEQCLVYFRPEGAFVVQRMRVAPGFFLSCDPVARLKAEPGADELGKAVVKALDGTRQSKVDKVSLSLPPAAGPERPHTVDSDGTAARVEGLPVPRKARELGQALLESAHQAARNAANPPEPRAPLGFGYKTAWACAASQDPELVIQEFKLRAVRAAGWEHGLQSRAEGEVFVTPCIQGKVLVVGLPYPDPAAEPLSDPVLLRIEGLSQRLGEVCYFASDRVVDLSAWARAEQGTIARAFAYLGELGATLWKLGPPTPAERGFRFFDDTSEEAEEPEYWQRTDLTYPDEESVLAVARSWALDPTRLEEMGLPPSTGWLGRLPG